LQETLLESTRLTLNDAGISINVIGGKEEKQTAFPETKLYHFSLASNYTLRDVIKESFEGSKDPASELMKYLKVTSEFINQAVLLERQSVRWYYPKDCIWGIGFRSVMGLGRPLDDMFGGDDRTQTLDVSPGGNVYLPSLWIEGNKNMTSKEMVG
jgi:hypothetical protein